MPVDYDAASATGYEGIAVSSAKWGKEKLPAVQRGRPVSHHKRKRTPRQTAKEEVGVEGEREDEGKQLHLA